MIYKKQGGLKSKIPPGKRLIGDKIYLTKNTPEISGRNLYDDEKLGKFKERLKARHETFNSRIKSFDILKNRFRSKVDRMKKHQSVMTTICVAIEYPTCCQQSYIRRTKCYTYSLLFVHSMAVFVLTNYTNPLPSNNRMDLWILFLVFVEYIWEVENRISKKIKLGFRISIIMETFF